MSILSAETKKVKLLLDEIESNPEIFDKLGNAKIGEALTAYYCVSLENLSHVIGEFNQTMKNMLKHMQRKDKGFFQDTAVGD